MNNVSGKYTTAEVLALVKQRAAEKALTESGMNPQIREWALADEARRASIKDMRGNDVSEPNGSEQGAHLLSIRSREKYLNRCAPEGADYASSEDFCSTSEYGVNGHAASHSLATTATQVEVDSLCSSTEEQEVDNGCASMTPDLAPDHPANFNVDFYEIKTDLFDNSDRGKKSSIHRAKLMIRSEPTTAAKDADVFMLDFYNRSRDINKRLREMELDEDDWYVRFKSEFSSYEKMLVAFDIAPKLAVLKEIDREDSSSSIIGYAAGIMFQIKNQPPTVILFYGASRYELVLDFEFNRKPGSPIYKKGIRRDADRQQMDVELSQTKKKFKIKTADDFS